MSSHSRIHHPHCNHQSYDCFAFSSPISAMTSSYLPVLPHKYLSSQGYVHNLHAYKRAVFSSAKIYMLDRNSIRNTKDSWKWIQRTNRGLSYNIQINEITKSPIISAFTATASSSADNKYCILFRTLESILSHL